MVDLLPGGTLTYVLHGTIDPSATGTLVNTVTVSGAGGVIDPNPANNIAVDTDTLTPQADFGIVVTDGQTVATPGAPLVYTIAVTHNGPSQSPAAMVTDSFPPVLTGVTWTCSATAGSSCGSPAGAGNISQPVSLLPGGTATYAASAVLSPSATGTLVNTATVAPPAGVADPTAGNNTHTDVDNVSIDLDGLEHGHNMTRNLAALPGPVAKQEYFWLSQSPYSSYEVVVDATSGDIGPGVILERVGADATSVLQIAAPVSSLAMSRSLRWMNNLPVSLASEFVRVRSAQCSTDCGTDDSYRIRAYETTYTIPRFNNAGSQVTVLILQNPASATIHGNVHFWSANGSLVTSRTFTLTAKSQLVLSSTTVPELAGLSGTITVSNDGRYGELTGKAVALEPSTGFSFDSAMQPRPR